MKDVVIVGALRTPIVSGSFRRGTWQPGRESINRTYRCF